MVLGHPCRACLCNISWSPWCGKMTVFRDSNLQSHSPHPLKKMHTLQGYKDCRIGNTAFPFIANVVSVNVIFVKAHLTQVIHVINA